MSLVYFIKIVDILETSPEMKNTFRELSKQVGWSAGGCVAGGLLAGPPGALVGTILGAFYGYATVREYDSLVVVVRRMTPEEKYRLEQKMQELIGSNLIEDLLRFVQNEINRQAFLSLVSNHAKGVGGE